MSFPYSYRVIYSIPAYVSLLIVFILLFSQGGRALAATSPGPGNGTTPGPVLPSTFLQGSLDLGDLGFNWQTKINIEGTERLVFQWKTNEAAEFGQYTVTDDHGEVMLVGDLLPSPPSGEYRLFFIDFSSLLPRERYEVRMQAMAGSQDPLGDPSLPVIVQIVCPGPVTQFIDSGLALPIDDQLDAIRKAHNVPALGGAIVTDKGIGVIGAVGIRKHGDATTVTENDKWHLGSNTKAITSTLLGILVDRGDVDWSHTIGDIFPEWASTIDPAFRDVTFKQLLANRSGLLETSENENSALWSSGTRPEQRKEHTRRIVHRAPQGIPNVTYQYHNSNFIIAGAMMEEITGRAWETLLQDELFDPLGMTSAGFLSPGGVDSKLIDDPWGHSDMSGSRIASRGDNAPALGPAGTVHASMRDWAKFVRLHLNGSQGNLSLSPATLSELHTEAMTDPVWPDRYGFGWVHFDEFGGPGLWHNGSNGLWYSHAQLYLDKGFGLIGVTNIGDGTNGNGRAAVDDVISLLKNRHLEEIPDPIPSPCEDRETTSAMINTTIQSIPQQNELAQIQLQKTLEQKENDLEQCIADLEDVSGDGGTNNDDIKPCVDGSCNNGQIN